jgi:hypothetical protein
MKYTIDTVKYISTMVNHCHKRGVDLNLCNPVTIQDKLAWLNIYDCNPLKTKCADKIKVREYCKEKLGEDICIPIIKIYDKAIDIKWEELPNQFVIKCNHGSGMNMICQDKSKFNKTKCIQNLTKWMNEDFAFRNGFEAHYHDIPHKILVEKMMGGGNLMDYKFWCFNGEPKLYTINDGHGHGNIIYYDMNGNELNFYEVNKPNHYKKPCHFDMMACIAKKLSKDFYFVRVDFYEVDGKIYLGELTFTPGECSFKYKKRENEIKVGELLKLPIENKEG